MMPYLERSFPDEKGLLDCSSLGTPLGSQPQAACESKLHEEGTCKRSSAYAPRQLSTHRAGTTAADLVVGHCSFLPSAAFQWLQALVTVHLCHLGWAMVPSCLLKYQPRCCRKGIS